MPTPQLKTSVTSNRPPATGFQIIVLVIVIALFSYFLLLPKYNDLATSQQTLHDSQTALSSLQTDQKNLDSLVTKLKASSTDVALLDEALPLQSRVSRIYVLIDNLVAASGMTLASVDVEAANTSDIAAGDKAVLANSFGASRKLQTNEISLSITGTLDQFENFLKQIETSSRILDIETMDIGAGEGSTLSFRLMLKTYSYAP